MVTSARSHLRDRLNPLCPRGGPGFTPPYLLLSRVARCQAAGFTTFAHRSAEHVQEGASAALFVQAPWSGYNGGEVLVILWT